jgi:hypothetical protein
MWDPSVCLTPDIFRLAAFGIKIVQHWMAVYTRIAQDLEENCCGLIETLSSKNCVEIRIQNLTK